MRSVVDRNVVMRRLHVLHFTEENAFDLHSVSSGP